MSTEHFLALTENLIIDINAILFRILDTLIYDPLRFLHDAYTSMIFFDEIKSLATRDVFRDFTPESRFRKSQLISGATRKRKSACVVF